MKKISFAISIFALLVIVACQHNPEDIVVDNGGGNNGGTDTIIIAGCDPDTVYFQNTILPLLVSNCAMSDCHDQVDPESDVRLYDYATIMEQVEASDLNSSDLWEAINEPDPADIMPPSPYAPLSSSDIALIQTWILQGALNNSCEDCDPTASSFANNIAPLIDLYCSGCHGGASPDGGLSLLTYDDISGSALDGSLMHSLNGTGGYTLMPDNTSGLPQCYKDQVAAWIAAGAPNN